MEVQKLDDVLEVIFEKDLKPSKIGLTNYNKYRSYKRRYQQGKLGRIALNEMLAFFGYEIKEVLVTKKAA